MPDNVKDNPVEKRAPSRMPVLSLSEDETQRCIMVEIYLEP